MSGYDVTFTARESRLGRKAVPHQVNLSAPASVRNALTGSLAVKGAKLFNLLPPQLRNSDHGDIPMFKNHLDFYLDDIPDEPTVPGLTRAAASNSLLEQVPMFNVNNDILF